MRLGYARVSTAEQKLDLQLDALKEAGCDKLFEDKATGKNTDRPGLQAALGYLREGDTLVVWKLDRLGRSLVDIIKTIDSLSERGVSFVSLQDGIDTTDDSPMKKFILSIFGALAQLEREIIKERTMAGLAAARARGRSGGRPPKLSGDQVRMLKQLHANPNNTIDEICQTMGIHKNTLYRYLKANKQAQSKQEKC